MTQMADVLYALGALREEAYAPSTGHFQSRARAAIHRELDRHHRRVAVISDLVHRRLRLVAFASTAAVAAIVALGWVAPAGSSLYPIRLAHEHLQLLLPGIDRSAAEMSDAESRLADAAAGRNQSASLDAAASLLAAARTDLPADHASAAWARWDGDEAELGRLRAANTQGDSSGAGGASNSSAQGSGAAGVGGAPSAENDHGGSTGGGDGDSHASSAGQSRGAGGGDEADHSSHKSGTTSSAPGTDRGDPGDSESPPSPEAGTDASHH